MVTYQQLNIGGQKITLGIDENMRVVDTLGNHVIFFEVISCGIRLSEKDLRDTILRKISLN